MKMIKMMMAFVMVLSMAIMPIQANELERDNNGIEVENTNEFVNDLTERALYSTTSTRNYSNYYNGKAFNLTVLYNVYADDVSGRIQNVTYKSHYSSLPNPYYSSISSVKVTSSTSTYMNISVKMAVMSLGVPLQYFYFTDTIYSPGPRIAVEH